MTQQFPVNPPSNVDVVGGTVTAQVQNVITAQIQNSPLTAGGTVTAQVGTVTAQVAGTLTASISNVVTGQLNQPITATITNQPVTALVSGTLTAQVGTVTAQVAGTLTAAISNVVTGQLNQPITANVNNVVTAQLNQPITANVNNVVTATVQGTLTAAVSNVVTAQMQGGTASISGISATVGTQAFLNNTGLLVYFGSMKTLKTTASAVSASGNNTIVLGVTSKRIKVYGYEICPTGMAATAFGTNCKLTDLVSDFSPFYDMSANSPITPGAVNPPNFLFGTLSGSGLVLNINGNVSVGYAIHYFDDDGA